MKFLGEVYGHPNEGFSHRECVNRKQYHDHSFAHGSTTASSVRCVERRRNIVRTLLHVDVVEARVARKSSRVSASLRNERGRLG